jgi:nucleotide-binding universal stress UspA family protein
VFEKILVCHDGSEGAEKALVVAIELSRLAGAELHMISVEEDLPHYVATVGEFEEVKRQRNGFFNALGERAQAAARGSNVELTHHVVAGHEVEAIVELAKEGAFDLLVIGFSGHSNVWGRIWGSTSQNLTRLAPCTVVVVK